MNRRPAQTLLCRWRRYRSPVFLMFAVAALLLSGCGEPSASNETEAEQITPSNLPLTEAVATIVIETPILKPKREILNSPAFVLAAPAGLKVYIVQKAYEVAGRAYASDPGAEVYMQTGGLSVTKKRVPAWSLRGKAARMLLERAKNSYGRGQDFDTFRHWIETLIEDPLDKGCVAPVTERENRDALKEIKDILAQVAIKINSLNDLLNPCNAIRRASIVHGNSCRGFADKVSSFLGDGRTIFQTSAYLSDNYQCFGRVGFAANENRLSIVGTYKAAICNCWPSRAELLSEERRGVAAPEREDPPPDPLWNCYFLLDDWSVVPLPKDPFLSQQIVLPLPDRLLPALGNVCQKGAGAACASAMRNTRC